MKKGFTLIELLAVIVILAIIALIATPIILGIINNAKKESDKRSVELYVKAVELAVARKNLASEFKPTECTVANGVCTCDGETLNVEVENGKGINGTIIFNDKGIVTDNTLVVGTATEKEPDEDPGEEPQPQEPEQEPEEEPQTSKECNLSDGVCANGEIVYFNVNDGTKCSENDYHEDNSNTGYNGIDNRTGNQNSCLKFYAFNDTKESDKVNLLLDHNTTAEVAWNSSGKTASGPNELLTQLTTDTSGWSTNILTPTNYTSPSKGYTVNYTTRARLITAQEIAQITGNTGWDESTATSGFSLSNFDWLIERMDIIYNDYVFGLNSNGYWTVSININGQPTKIGGSGNLYFDRFSSFKETECCGINGVAGVRPVIEISKSSLN